MLQVSCACTLVGSGRGAGSPPRGPGPFIQAPPTESTRAVEQVVCRQDCHLVCFSITKQLPCEAIIIVVDLIKRNALTRNSVLARASPRSCASPPLRPR